MNTRRPRRLLATAAAVLVATSVAGVDAAAARPGPTSAAQVTADSVCTRAYGSVEKLSAVRHGDSLMPSPLGTASPPVAAAPVLSSGCWTPRESGRERPWKRVSTDAGFGLLHSTDEDGQGRHDLTMRIAVVDALAGRPQAVKAALVS
jgi:hypothetical protein